VPARAGLWCDSRVDDHCRRDDFSRRCAGGSVLPLSDSVGRDRWFGGSVQKLLYLPEAHTDFVFAVYAEELGLIGVVVLVALYALLVALMMRVARRAERVNRGFGAFVVYGVTIWVACQTFISMSVNMGLLPTKGLTLPFMSYGGSSALALCIAFGIVVRIGLEATLYDTREGRS